MSERVENRHSVSTTCCRRAVMICKISNFDEIMEKFTKFLNGKKMIERSIFKCVNVCNVTCAHVCNMQIVQPINFPHFNVLYTYFSCSKLTYFIPPIPMKHL
jgi:hypothetical protein